MKANPFEIKGLEIVEIQKGEIFDTMCSERVGNPIQINKTAFEIKNQIENILLPKLAIKLESKKEQLLLTLDSCGQLPLNEVNCYKMKIEIPFKEYSYNETYYNNKESQVTGEIGNEGEVLQSDIAIYKEFTPIADESFEITNEKASEIQIFNWPLTPNQAKSREIYNNLLREYIEILLDIKTLIALKQIEDNKSYSLNINQVIALDFTDK